MSLRSPFGRPPITISTYSPGLSKNASIDSTLTNREYILRQLKHILAQTRQMMKSQADKHREEKEFQRGELVYVKLKMYRPVSVHRRASNKLTRLYFGPYHIIRRIGTIAYHVDLLESSRIHPLFHVLQLRVCKGTPPQPGLPLSLVTDNGHLTQTPVRILSTREVWKNGQRKWEALVEWSGAGNEEATWEDFGPMVEAYQYLLHGDELSLEDTAPSEEESNVIPSLAPLYEKPKRVT